MEENQLKHSTKEDSSAPLPSQGVTPQKKFKPLWIIISVLVLLILAGSAYFVKSQAEKSAEVKTEKVYHVGVLSALDYFFPAVDSFKQEMTKLGYIEGKNIIYDVQKGAAPVGNQDIIKKFVGDKVDLILVFPTEASLEAKDETKETNIPIISLAAYVDGNGLIDSIQHPGGNITGVRFPIAEVAAKRLEILHEIVPKAKRIWVPYLKDYPTVAPSIEAVKPLASSLGLTIIEAPFKDPGEMTAYFKKHSKDPGMDAILLIPEPVSIIPAFADQINSFASLNDLPIAGISLKEDSTGSIFSLLPSSLAFGALAAPLADKIFKGTPPGDIPIITPENELQINYKAIQNLKLKVNEGLLSRAKRIIR